jgi:4-coumarate--CoA ligase
VGTSHFNSKADSLHYFQGYYNRPEATRDSMDSDDFVKTGDIGYVNEQGFVYVIDRKKDIFKYCGHHINPSEIENVILTLDEVEFVSVVGIPNVETYNLPAAVIKLKEGSILKESDVIEFATGKLPEYKQLHGGVYFVNEMPATKNDKILKREAKEIASKLFKERSVK